MTTSIVLDAVEQAIWVRSRAGVTDLAGLVHHNDRGSQTRLNRWKQHQPVELTLSTR